MHKSELGAGETWLSLWANLANYQTDEGLINATEGDVTETTFTCRMIYIPYETYLPVLKYPEDVIGQLLMLHMFAVQ